jgi:hypothetical protein
MSSPAESTLLAPLSGDQQRFVDLIADAFLAEEYEWPIFHYLEWILDEEGHDAWEILQSFPQIGRWGYGPIAWVPGGPAMKPTAETEIALTVVGIARSRHLRDHVETFFLLLEYLAHERRAARPSRRQFVEPSASSDGFAAYCRNRRGFEIPHPRLAWQLLEREPPGVFGSRSYNTEDHTWMRAVPREVLELEGVTSLADYLSRLDRWLVVQESVASFSAPAIPLPAAIDHLDDVWRLTFGSRLFQFTGAERVASLTEEVSSRDEYESRLSVIGDLLRTANRGVGNRSRRRPRDKLSSLEERISSRLEESGQGRTSDAITSLEAVLALRDSRQHGGASHRAMAATQRLGLPYPISDWGGAWQTVSARTVQALGVIGDELRARLD